jgi:brefeldin A-resistance guanine nucleotide exchange factor 1
MNQNQFQFEDNQMVRLFNTKHYEPFNQCEETNSRMIVIGEITSIEVVMKMNYEFLNVNTNLNYGNKKPQFSRSQSTLAYLDEEDDEFLSNSDLTNNQLNSPSNNSILSVYRNFKSLKDRLKNKSLNVLMDYSYLKPFCDLIVNKDISGRITAIALGSLLKFLNYGLIDYTENQGSAQLLCETMIKVKFIGTNASSDEVVLMRILLLIKELVTRGFNLITNRTLYGMIRTCFRVIFEHNLSELLRKSAEHTLIDIVRILFMRLDEFKDSERLLNLENNKSGIQSINNKKQSSLESNNSNSNNNKELTSTKLNEQLNSNSITNLNSKEDNNKNEITTNLSTTTTTTTTTTNKPQQKCYDLDCIYDLFNYLAQIVNPNEQNNNLMSNQVGLNVLIVIFETAVISIGEKASLMKIVKNDLCWSLVNIIQSGKQLTLFSLGLRLSSIIFLHLRMQLKYQFQEVLIKVLEILSSKTSPLEYKDIAIDFLHTFFQQIPFLPHELFINYDLDPYALNILDDLLNLLSKNCFLNSKLTNIQNTGDSEIPVLNFVKKMSFNLLLLILKSLQRAELNVKKYILMPNSNLKFKKLIADNLVNDDNETSTNNEFKNKNFFLPTNKEQINYLKERKKLIWEASENFNAKPSKGTEKYDCSPFDSNY